MNDLICNIDATDPCYVASGSLEKDVLQVKNHKIFIMRIAE